MISCSFASKWTKYAEYQLNVELFEERLMKVVNTYNDLFNLNTRWYSQIIKPSIFPAEPSGAEIHIHFVALVAKFEDLSQLKKIPIGENDIPEKTTHLALLDIFGRISKIVPIDSSKNSYIFRELFGDNLIGNFGGLSEDKFSVVSLFPLGWVNLQMMLLQTDQLGFRFQLEDKQIHNTNKDGDTINIAIVGGSFAAACYCLAGESFAEKLAQKFRANNPDKKINIWNFAQGSVTQSTCLSYLLNTGIVRKIDYVIWVDGLNDIWSTIPAKSIGLNNFNTSFTLKSYLSGVRVSSKLMNSIPILDKIESFTSYRRLAIDLLEGLGVKSFNYLQPVCDLNNPKHSAITKELLPHFSKDCISTCIQYPQVSPFIHEIGKSKYGIDFKMIESIETPLEFWDSAHLSPKGELQYADFLYNSLIESGEI